MIIDVHHFISISLGRGNGYANPVEKMVEQSSDSLELATTHPKCNFSIKLPYILHEKKITFMRLEIRLSDWKQRILALRALFSKSLTHNSKMTKNENLIFGFVKCCHSHTVNTNAMKRQRFMEANGPCATIRPRRCSSIHHLVHSLSICPRSIHHAMHISCWGLIFLPYPD